MNGAPDTIAPPAPAEPGVTAGHWCLIGNSHLGMVRRAWNALAPQQPGLRVDFFGCPSHHFGELVREGTVLRPVTDHVRDWMAHTSGGQTTIQLARYDRVVLVDLDFRAARLFMLAKSAVTTGFARHPAGASLVSTAVFQACATGSLAQSTALVTAAKIAAARPELEIVLQAGPLPGLEAGGIYRRLRDSGDHGHLRVAYDRAVAQLAAAWPRVRIVQQPDDTVIEQLFTRTAYVSGQRRGGKAARARREGLQPPGELTPEMAGPARGEAAARIDQHHMNAAFGERLWQLWLAMPVPGAAAGAADRAVEGG